MFTVMQRYVLMHRESHRESWKIIQSSPIQGMKTCQEMEKTLLHRFGDFRLQIFQMALQFLAFLTIYSSSHTNKMQRESVPIPTSDVNVADKYCLDFRNDLPSLIGKICVITGTTSGTGYY